MTTARAKARLTLSGLRAHDAEFRAMAAEGRADRGRPGVQGG